MSKRTPLTPELIAEATKLTDRLKAVDPSKMLAALVFIVSQENDEEDVDINAFIFGEQEDVKKAFIGTAEMVKIGLEAAHEEHKKSCKTCQTKNADEPAEDHSNHTKH